MNIYTGFALASAVLALLYGGMSVKWILARPEGNERMREIASTYQQAGVTPLFHQGAEWVFERLAATPLAAETRADLPEHRSLDEALAAFIDSARE